MKHSSKPIATALLTLVVAVPSVSYAWNIICGISVGMVQESFAEISGKKWEADSHALRGIGLFYLAVSELQRIELPNKEDVKGDVIVPNSLWHQDTPSTSEAIKLLAGSANEVERSLVLAKEYGLGDDKGLTLLSQLQESLNSSRQVMSDEGKLPDLKTMHNIARAINEYVEHGITLSVNHLGKGLEGHGTGGIQF